MKKRFIDCDKFDDPWFRKLSPDHKVLWDFITCKCDNSGVWKIDFELARFMTGCFELNEENALRAFNEGKRRVVTFKPGYWFIVGFVDFQFGGYDGNNNFHKQIKGLLEKHGLEQFQGQTRGCLAPLVKDKEKDKEQEKEIVILEEKHEKKPFGEHGLVMLTQEEHEKLLVKLGERVTADYVSRLENYIGSKGKKYKSHYHTILSWTANPKSGESVNPLNLNKTQESNMGALSDFLAGKKGTSRPENLRSGDGDAVIRIPRGEVQS